jgi:hypothetical protein
MVDANCVWNVPIKLRSFVALKRLVVTSVGYSMSISRLRPKYAALPSGDGRSTNVAYADGQRGERVGLVAIEVRRRHEVGRFSVRKSF